MGDDWPRSTEISDIGVQSIPLLAMISSLLHVCGRRRGGFVTSAGELSSSLCGFPHQYIFPRHRTLRPKCCTGLTFQSGSAFQIALCRLDAMASDGHSGSTDASIVKRCVLF